MAERFLQFLFPFQVSCCVYKWALCNIILTQESVQRHFTPYPYLRAGTYWQGLAPGVWTTEPSLYRRQGSRRGHCWPFIYESKLCGNNLSTLKQLKLLITKLNISSMNHYFCWVFLKVRSEGNNIWQAGAYGKKEKTLQVMQGPVKVNSWGWESRRRRKGWARDRVLLTGLLKVRRRRSLVFILSASSCLELAPAHSFVSHSFSVSLLSQHNHLRNLTATFYLSIGGGKKMLRAKKRKKEKKGTKGGLRKQNVVGHRFDNIQGIFLSLERSLLWSQDTRHGALAHWKCKCILGRWWGQTLLLPSFRILLLLLLLSLLFALFHFDLSIHGLCVREEAVDRRLCAKVLRPMKYLLKQ